MATKKKMLQAAAGVGGAGLDITDVFSTYLYEGNGSARTITNGIDLSGEGGLTWIKTRETATYSNNMLYDTENGANYFLRTNGTNALTTASGFGLTAFNSDGFDMGIAYGNESGIDTASWTFRKAPKFFDVVTWTGNGVAGMTVPHNLGSVPAVIITKRVDAVSGWYVYHRSLGATKNLQLSSTLDARLRTQIWNDTEPTSTDFTLGTDTDVNASGGTYVAYLFAHNDGDGEFGPSGDQDIIKCGSFTTDGSGVADVNLGFEPAWLLTKASSTTSYWALMDEMRGFGADVGMDYMVQPNTSNAEVGPNYLYKKNATGFSTASLSANQTYIYMAIRRGPLAQPESGTEVFETKTYSGTGAAQTLTTSLNGSDMALTANRSTSGALNPGAYDRLRGDEYLQTSNTSAAIGSDSYGISVLSNKQNTVDVGNFASTSGQTYVGQIFKRAPGFFDGVAWTAGSSTNRRLSHNLEVTPEFAISKSRSNAGTWWVYHKDLGSDKYINLDLTSAASTLVGAWPSPTETEFGVRESHYFASGWTVVTYLFATLPGVSKVGSYTGNGSSQTIDCGFTSGARFILVKRTDSTGDWYVWDTERGIVAGNDPHLSLNTTAAEVTSDDSIDPDNSGFIVNQVGATNINVSSASYIFYAIA